jgi:transposase
MIIKIFTEKEIDALSNNKYVKKVSNKVITYTEEFRRTFISENENGESPRTIFENYGFDINIIGMNRVNSAGKRWRKAYRKEGIYGLADSRVLHSGRPKGKKQTIENLKARINLLEGENELLKKVNSLERRAIKK